MSAYYNEHDPRAAQWLRELIADGSIADGTVDERSIADVQPDDLRGFVQCHFFAGIGLWSAALRLAGISDDTRVWTGSCPCQSFSAAGKGAGFDDPRGQLWFEFLRLIRELRPPAIFGEQVAAAIGHGWLDRVCDDLEGEGYAVGAHVLGAFSSGAPHIRQRLYWGARLVNPELRRPEQRDAGERAVQEPDAGRDDGGRVRHAVCEGLETEREKQAGAYSSDGCTVRSNPWSLSIWHQCSDGRRRRVPARERRGDGQADEETMPQPGVQPLADDGRTDGAAVARGGEEGARSVQGAAGWPTPTRQDSVSARNSSAVRYTDAPFSKGDTLVDAADKVCGWPTPRSEDSEQAVAHRGVPDTLHSASALSGEATLEADPDLWPLAPSEPGRVMLLRGAGNCIVPQLAAVFIEEFMGAINER